MVQRLWNWRLPAIFDMREVTFWQALGLLALCRILFAGFGKGGFQHSNSRKDHKDWWKKAAEDRARERAEAAGVPAASQCTGSEQEAR